MERSKYRILIVEDDLQLQKFISYTLNNGGYQYSSSVTGQGALSKLVSERFDIILLDLGLPDLDGMDIVKKVREWSEIPIIVVSARDQDEEKAAALDGGADDYLTKPFSATELLARIRVALRHIRQQSNHAPGAILSVGDLQINFKKRMVYLNKNELHMTPM